LEMGSTEHDHWLLYALNQLQRLHANDLYVDHAVYTAKAIMNSQLRGNIAPDWVGGYFQPPCSAPTATRTEGLCQAYELIRDFGEGAGLLKEMLQSIELGIHFQLRTQLTPERAMYLPNPQSALGGFHASLTDYTVRIDYVQHSVSSLLEFLDLIQKS